MEPSRLKIVIENKVPYMSGVFNNIADVVMLPANEINADTIADAYALVIRTRTQCNESLLKSSNVKLIATATIGTDHIDMKWCEAASIKVVNAPGCNAPAVAQYVLRSIIELKGDDLSNLTLGIIGVGNVGKIVARWAEGLSMNVLLNDPPRQKAEGIDSFDSIEEIAEKADIITFHTPLVKDGDYPTFHLADKTFFNKLKRKPIIINSARGGVTDTQALLNALENDKISAAVIDCWENEPEISSELLEKASIATPHIAGYSDAGKRRASLAAIKAVSQFFSIPQQKITLPQELKDIPSVPEFVDAAMLRSTYNPTIDSFNLKANPLQFESLRNSYSLRREPSLNNKKFESINLIDPENYIGKFVEQSLRESISVKENLHCIHSDIQNPEKADLSVWCSLNPTPDDAIKITDIASNAKSSAIVMLSSTAIYNVTEGENYNEHTPVLNNSQISKAEEIIRNWGQTNSVDVTILRLPELVIGTGMSGILSSITKGIVRSTYTHIKNSQTRKTCIHASSVGEAIICSAGTNGTFNISDYSDPLLSDLTDALSYRIGKRIYSVSMSNAKRKAQFFDLFSKRKTGSEMYRFQTSTLTFSAGLFRSTFPNFNPVSTIFYLKNHVYDESSL